MAVGHSDAPKSSIVPSGDNGDGQMENGQPALAVTAEDDVWDEQKIEESLKTLKEMYIQLRDLRSTIPRLIAPLTTKQPSPETLFRSFSESASTATREVQAFRRLMTDERSTKILDHARQSRADNPKGIKPWRITDDPDWNHRES
ncbi:hypothetical protein BP5796_08669 [Coleophoma crateriformis]|uniref:Uncharacterized protein n=1 Tax=Coleophoma crateriformis TaxID=565419 RepID=A0A3D8R8A5_9HELO|nr:hypothetical protein BP5796_08669 [Coleophoma crateriformis]